MHFKASRCSKDKVTGSKRSPDQVRAALEFLCDFVQTNSAVDPAQILIPSPYKAMIETITSMRKKPECMAINKVRPASTIDSIQGQEGDMVVVITGTTTQYGPGFTTDERRLNVILSRHKSALVIFGDIHVVKSIDQVKVKANPDEKEAACPIVLPHTPEGDLHKCRPKMLHKVHVMLVAAFRFTAINTKGLGWERR
ncbi:AAA domain-containing protein [Ilyonectria robusta]|uniref:AAA domain-containing protein n=1 Tax=Ilyonectria robusta TaxID=1079257 RepID=UPI001E8E5BBA|nr:AAA domain-containing protein [Ilyonectria robusta]KAH8667820.1 AAA domain-containing protein [Ilyonectria robusta]